MNTPSSRSFGDMFSATWSTFRNNYGLCLGIAVIFCVIYAISMFINIIVVGVFSSDESGIPGGIASSVLNIVMVGALLVPLFTYMGFWLVQRVRGGERSRRGRFGTIVVIGILVQLCFLPGQIAQSFGNPGNGARLHLMPELFGAGFEQGISKGLLDEALKRDVEQNGELKKDSPNAAKRMAALAPLQERFDKAQERMKSLQKKMQGLAEEQKPGLMIISFLLFLIAFIFTYFWAPWSMYAAIDPLEESSNIGATLSRGRELARNSGPFTIWLVPLVFLVIMCVTCVMCCLPGIFFGIPLAFAVIPSMYMCLRGDVGGGELPVAT